MWPIFSASLPTFGIVTIFNFSHSYRYVLISYCGFNSHFPSGYWCWTYFHVPTCHLYILFGEMSVHVFVYFLMRLFLSFFQLSFEHSLYIVDTNPSSNKWLTNIFSQSVLSLSMLFTWSFTEQKFLIFMKSVYQFSFYISHLGVQSKDSMPNPRFSLVFLLKV